MKDTVPRFAVTHKAHKGMRQLTFAAQGRHTYETQKQAEEALEAFVENGLDRVLSKEEMDSLEVRSCECWAGHFDPVSVWFKD